MPWEDEKPSNDEEFARRRRGGASQMMEQHGSIKGRVCP